MIRRRWCTWDSNPGRQDSRCRRIHQTVFVSKDLTSADKGRLLYVYTVISMTLRKSNVSLWAIGGLFFVYFRSFHTLLQNKTVDFRGIQTQIVRIETSTLTTCPHSRPSSSYFFAQQICPWQICCANVPFASSLGT